MKTPDALASLALAAAVTVAAGATARGDVVWGDFETGTAPGFGALTNSGVQPWTAPVAGNVITAPSGALAGSKVLELTGSASFNFGQANGGALGFDFLSQNLRSAFLANDQIEFDWYPTPDPTTSAGFSQLYNVILNSAGGGFVNVDGYSAGNANLNQYYYTGYNGILHHVVVNYAAYKATILASATPDGGNYLQLGIQPNAGGGAPADYYFDNFKFSIAPNVWNVDADGTWSNDGNWLPASPTAAGKVASFGPAITAPRTVTLDAPRTVGQLLFNNANAYTIAGSSALTLDGTGSVAITVSNGSHAVTAPLSLAKDANITVGAAGSTLTLSALQPSAVAITKAGAGVLAVNNVRAGSLTVNAGQVRVQANGSATGVSTVASVSVGAGSALDVTNNKLIVTTAGSTGSWTGTAYTGVAGMVAAGRNGGAWNGSGITTSSATAGSNLTTLATGKVGDFKNVADAATTTFAGQTVHGSDTVVMYTYGGDANLDGKINIDDYGRIDGHVSIAGSTGWYNGDFNYDGKINIDDYGIIDSNIGSQSVPLA